MQEKHPSNFFAALLFLTLVLSFLWCTLDNIARSAGAAGIGASDPVPIGIVLVGVLWLVSHGIHGAAAIALPAFYWRHTLVEN